MRFNPKLRPILWVVIVVLLLGIVWVLLLMMTSGANTDTAISHSMVASSVQQASQSVVVSSSPKSDVPIESEALQSSSSQIPAEREVISIRDFGGMPYVGEAYGRLTISGTKVDCDLYYGDSEAQLSKGGGTYTGAKIPGQNGTVLVAGHTGNFFRDFESAQIGADIMIETRYGTYHYEIVNMQDARAEDTTAYDLTTPEENIILYTCYPFGQLTPTPFRYFIYGKFVSGPEIRP